MWTVFHASFPNQDKKVISKIFYSKIRKCQRVNKPHSIFLWLRFYIFAVFIYACISTFIYKHCFLYNHKIDQSTVHTCATDLRPTQNFHSSGSKDQTTTLECSCERWTAGLLSLVILSLVHVITATTTTAAAEPKYLQVETTNRWCKSKSWCRSFIAQHLSCVLMWTNVLRRTKRNHS